MSVAADVSDWIATPAPLNSNKCGKNAVFSSDNSVVQRRDPWYEECVCYTVHPLPPGLVWQTTVLETTTKWSRGLVCELERCFTVRKYITGHEREQLASKLHLTETQSHQTEQQMATERLLLH
ncbi:hypothetical protein GBAR_LOCUS29700 [Geodia barretti]|uniref:Homeobox domain-containing protein n=1 Tax=Geodia barretti TaxID=519541 RepID=A0AA35XJS9_GEOBA|nr:hypothetical protein GBAR_LOCUS29700 [Geodia barretti]